MRIILGFAWLLCARTAAEDRVEARASIECFSCQEGGLGASCGGLDQDTPTKTCQGAEHCLAVTDQHGDTSRDCDTGEVQGNADTGISSVDICRRNII